MTPTTFEPCEICGGTDWESVYSGAIRNGGFGNVLEHAEISRCGDCGVERLNEASCFDNAHYETDAYRSKLEQKTDTAGYLKQHDSLQRHTLEALWPTSLRGKTVADIGCAGGSFLDHVSGIAERLVAIEPATMYHKDLRRRGYHTHAFAEDAAAAFSGKVDVAVSSQVIEHVLNPRAFLVDIAKLLASDGTLLISTPNRDDILMDLLPDNFPAFFYRSVHRWYFDAASLAHCAERAGLTTIATHYVHRYDMANALLWLRDRRPSGLGGLPVLDGIADGFWKSYLEGTGRADCLYMAFRRADSV